MATQVKHRRGTQSEIDVFTPAIGEIVMNTTEEELVLGNGIKQGGVPVPKKDTTMLSFNTLSDAVSNTALKAGYSVNLENRITGGNKGSVWDVVIASTVTPNGFNIVQCTGVATLALVLRTDDVNVLDFGATGDGVTDDTAAIQAAIDFCNFNAEQKNFKLDLGRGKYRITDTLNLTGNNSGLTIDGSQARILVDGDMDYAFNMPNITEVSIDGLTVNYVSGTQIAAMRFEGTRHRFHGISISTGFEIAILMDNVKESHITNFRCDLDVTGLTGTLIRVDQSFNNTISHSFIGYADIGIHFTTVGSNEGNLVSDNIIVKCNYAVKGDKCTLNNINNNVIDFIVKQGVFITNGLNNVVSNNWIASDATSTSFIGIGCNPTSEGLIVSNNFLVGNAGSVGNAFSLNCPKVIATNNQISGTLGVGFQRTDSYLMCNIGANGFALGDVTHGSSTQVGEYTNTSDNFNSGQPSHSAGIVHHQSMITTPITNASAVAWYRAVAGTFSDQLYWRFAISSSGEKEVVEFNGGGIDLLQNGNGVTFKSPDGLTSKILSIDNAGNPVWS